ncbi:hypothetical protein Vadar_018183 [Vaccinium darrowii]|uniref:Uncharacterized protein n=1 Tax=Vaccinium darrowii TaxID=229202 RepID=A0ACB7Z4T2_9ERIC|nr:hypothetical protein Vadar_018183 [Vaccinium darrowii]
MGESPERKSGCGLLSAVFGRRNVWPRRTTSTGSLPIMNDNGNNLVRVPSTPISKRRRDGSSDEATFLETTNATSETSQKQVDRIIARPGSNHPKVPPSYQNYNQHQQCHQNQGTGKNAAPLQGYAQGRRVPQASTGISGELENMITDHQRSKGANSLVRASSGNVMLFGHLGNLRQPGGGGGNMTSNNVLNYLPKTAREEPERAHVAPVVGNVGNKRNEDSEKTPAPPTSLCRALSTRMDPEQLKIMGNEDYKNGRFAEALALYDAAISIDPNKASYRSNKSAALTALGRLLEAVFECREAIRIEPYFQRAHNRLATLYVRLGEVDKALYHYKHAGAESDPDVLTKAKNLQVHLSKCTDAKKQRDWNTLLKETKLAISAGADSAAQIFALQAEALLKLRRPQDADEALKKGPNFDTDECTKFFGPIGNANLLLIRAQVDMAAGRLDNAMEAAQRAARLDSNNKEVNAVARRTRAVAMARSNGNELFTAKRYSEACVAYGEGLDHDPYNAVLLLNRATCRAYLGQLEKSIEDCTAALNLRPSYAKAKLRRIDCYIKLEKWEACIQDYEEMIRETPEDETLVQGLKDAQLQLKKQRGEDASDMQVGGSHDVVSISSNEHFRELVTSPGVSVVLFCNKPGDNETLVTLQFLEQLRKKYPSANFYKVDVEEHPSVAKSEGVSSLPAFKIYKNGSRVKEIAGDNQELLESSVKYYTT